MEAAELTESAFWESEDCRVLAPPGLESEGEHLGRLLEGEEAVIFTTSGSSGAPKWVLFRRRALLASARAVNLHLQIGSGDSFLVALPLYHVGGFGMGARAFVGGCALHHFEESWDAERFRDKLEKTECTLTSLVPTQVHDLVSIDPELVIADPTKGTFAPKFVLGPFRFFAPDDSKKSPVEFGVKIVKPLLEFGKTVRNKNEVV